MSQIAAILLILVTLWGNRTATAYAADALPPSETSCKDQIAEHVGWAQRDFRRVIFGSTGSLLTVEGETIHRLGGATEKGYYEPEKDDLIGIFETRKRLTSELVEPLVESYRVYSCYSSAVCEALNKSFLSASRGATLTVAPLGCRSIKTIALDQCTFLKDATKEQTENTFTFCKQTVQQTLRVDRAALKMAVAYDAGYRSVIQMVGIVNEFVEKLPLQTFNTFRQMAGLLGKLHQIPCYLAHCDLPPQSSSSSQGSNASSSKGSSSSSSSFSIAI